MKRKIFAALLAICLFVGIAPPVRADSSGVCFIVNDNALLELGSMPVYSGGTVYVPCRAFTAYGIYSNYYEADTTAMLNNGSKQIFFNLTTGNSYDSTETIYSVSAIFKNGLVYVPVAWVAEYFGLSYSYINGNGNGDIVRIKNTKNSSELLSDSDYLRAASSLMKVRYNEYFGKTEPSPPPTKPAQPSEVPALGDDNRSETAVTLCFTGIPDTKLLDAFDAFGFKACFFVTEQEALNNPDILRRISGSGHSLGINCLSAPNAEGRATTEAIFSAAQLMPTLITSPPAIAEPCRTFAAENGLSYYRPGTTIGPTESYASNINKKIEAQSGYVNICMESKPDTDKILRSVLQFLAKNKFSVLPLRETFI
ncbi:MAG: stalk domain-containing protein [Oscillospiraceae bacterium]